MSTALNARNDRNTVKPIADRIVALLTPACEPGMITIAGSLRRESASVGDVEIVAVPKVEQLGVQLDMFGGASVTHVNNRLESKLEEMIDHRLISKRAIGVLRTNWGERYKSFFASIGSELFIGYLPSIKFDLFAVLPPAEWGAILTIRTGPSEFIQHLMFHINRATPYQQLEGRLVIRETGATVPTPTEQSYFEILGVDYLPPQERSLTALRKAIKFPV